MLSIGRLGCIGTIGKALQNVRLVIHRMLSHYACTTESDNGPPRAAVRMVSCYHSIIDSSVQRSQIFVTIERGLLSVEADRNPFWQY